MDLNNFWFPITSWCRRIYDLALRCQWVWSGIWSEQGRLHLSYKGVIEDDNEAEGGQIEITTDIDGNDIGTDHGIRVNDLILVAGNNTIVRCVVNHLDTASSEGADRITVSPYGFATLAAAGLTDTTAVTILVYGSEFKKGSAADYRTTANEANFKTFSNKPIIMRDYYEVSGSDASKIGWVEISTENGLVG